MHDSVFSRDICTCDLCPTTTRLMEPMHPWYLSNGLVRLTVERYPKVAVLADKEKNKAWSVVDNEQDDSTTL